jgi:hypothetical protein
MSARMNCSVTRVTQNPFRPRNRNVNVTINNINNLTRIDVERRIRDNRRRVEILRNRLRELNRNRQNNINNGLM